MDEIIIKRKKLRKTFEMIFYIFFVITWTSCSLLGIYSYFFLDNKKDISSLITGLIILLFMVILIKLLVLPIRKLFSKNPELIINKDYIQVFDNPKFDKIPFVDMMGLDIIYLKSQSILRVFLLENSKVYSKPNRHSYNINSSVPKVAFVDISFADIPHDKLKQIIYDKIEE